MDDVSSSPYHVSLERLKQATRNLLVRANRYGPATYVTFWVMLKMRGLKPQGEPVLVKEENGGPLLDELLRVEYLTDYIEADDSPYYDVFVGATRKESADKNYWQNNIGNFYQHSNASDPEKWLEVTETDGEYYAAYTEEFADYLGDGKNGFAPEGKQLNIPLVDLMAWCYRYEQFDEKVTYQELFDRFTNQLNLTQIELNLVFDQTKTELDNFFEESVDIDKKKKGLAEYLADHLQDQQSGYSVDFDPSDLPPAFTEEERETIIYSSKKTTYDTFDSTVDPSEDIRQAITADGERNLILVGPPGTGKTHLAIETAKDLGEEIFFFQFHDSYSYGDFVESYEPVFNNGEVEEFRPVKKGFLKACDEAETVADDEYVFVILDEINRANVSAVFGELFSLIEYREDFESSGMTQYTLHSGDQITVPDNLIIVGTMNNVDKSTEDLEFALRRRFSEIELPPSTEVLRDILRDQNEYDWDPDEVEELCLLLNLINEKGEYPLGPTYFKETEGLNELLKTYRRKIRPSVKQYFGEFQEDQLKTIDRFFQQAARLELSDSR